MGPRQLVGLLILGLVIAIWSAIVGAAFFDLYRYVRDHRQARREQLERSARDASEERLRVLGRPRGRVWDARRKRSRYDPDE